MTLKQIWAAETGEYEDRHIAIVGDSPEAVAEGLKIQHERYRAEHPENSHCNGYDVEWFPLTKINDEEYAIIAQYIGSQAIYEITLMDYASQPE